MCDDVKCTAKKRLVNSVRHAIMTQLIHRSIVISSTGYTPIQRLGSRKHYLAIHKENTRVDSYMWLWFPSQMMEIREG